MTATDLDTMHRAVLLDPGDDLARLAYADALEEAGDVERAEFVRLGVPHGKEQGRETFGPVGLREEELVSKNAPAWLRDIIPPGAKYLVDYGWGSAPGGVRLVWRRGFIESIALPLAAFMDNAEVLFRAHPITAVTLTDRGPDGALDPEGEMHGFWRWQGCVGDHGQPSDPSPDNLPPALWDAMKALNAHQRPERVFDWSGWLYFTTPELARAALSAACVAYGRALAGLPPLPVHPPADTGMSSAPASTPCCGSRPSTTWSRS